jgi:hypothetical protein
MTEEEKDIQVKRLLMAYEPEELKELRAECLEMTDAWHLGKCAKRLRQIAEHELADHKCVGSYLYLMAVAKRLEWYHSQVQRHLETMKKLETIQ